MSTIKVTNLQATGETATRAVSGVAAAWASINGSASTPTFRDSQNFSSITDHSAGDQTVTVTSAMANANYCIQGSTSWQGGTSRNNMNIATNKTVGSEAPTTTSVRYEIANYTNGSAYDGDFVMITFNGDLA